ncbi:hypothetical protein Tco_0745751 [Tanacetum coccineum]
MILRILVSSVHPDVPRELGPTMVFEMGNSWGERSRFGSFVRTGLITPDLICPSTYQPLQSSSGDSRPDVSFDMSPSPEYLSGLAYASLAEVFKLRFFSGRSEGDYTS